MGRVGTWTLAGQHLGVGMLNPIYYSHHTHHTTHLRTTADPTRFSLPAAHAAAILPAVVLGGILPCYLLITHATSLDSDTYQLCLAALQPFGIYISLFHYLFSKLLTPRGPSSRARDPELPYLRAVYAITLLFATGLHNAARFMHTSPSPSPGTSPTAFSLASLYTPTLARVSPLSDVVVVFMRNDVLVLGWGAVGWAGWLLWAEGLLGAGGVCLAGGLGYVGLGPGGACVAGMWLREEMVRRKLGRREGGGGKEGKRL